MTQTEVGLVFKDLCARIPYGTCIETNSDSVDGGRHILILCNVNATNILQNIKDLDVKPYLRSMDSMTEEEYGELRKETVTTPNLETTVVLFWEHHYESEPHWRNDWSYCNLNAIDWLNSHHFDYRGLIGRGLAIEAPEGMYTHFGDMKTVVTIENKGNRL